MAAPKRDKRTIEQHRDMVAALYAQSMPLLKIADTMSQQTQIKYSLDMVKRDLRVIKENWKKSAAINFDQAKSEQLAKLDALEEMAWQELNRSTKPFKKTSIETTGGAYKERGASKQRVEQYDQTGDPRYMNVILSVIERRSRILGLDAPTKITETDPSGKKHVSEMSRDEKIARIQELQAKAKS